MVGVQDVDSTVESGDDHGVLCGVEQDLFGVVYPDGFVQIVDLEAPKGSVAESLFEAVRIHRRGFWGFKARDYY
jgi:hypothetical protein